MPAETNPSRSGVVPTPEAYDRISEATRFYERSYRNRGLKGELRKRFQELTTRGKIFEGYLCDDMSPAESTLSGASTAKAVKLIKDQETGDLTHGPEVTITNRSTSTAAESGTYIQWTRINGENRPVWVDCEAEVSSSCPSGSE